MLRSAKIAENVFQENGKPRESRHSHPGEAYVALRWRDTPREDAAARQDGQTLDARPAPAHPGPIET
jgi:hypothetical protein